MPAPHTPAQNSGAKDPASRSSHDARDVSVKASCVARNATSTAASTMVSTAPVHHRAGALMCPGRLRPSAPAGANSTSATVTTATPHDSEEATNRATSHGVRQKSTPTMSDNKSPV